MASKEQAGIPFTPDVVHPGEIVSEYVEFHGWTQRDLARRTGLTPKTISEIYNGKAPLTPTTALALEKVLRRPAHFWLNLQRQYDEAEARNRELRKSTVDGSSPHQRDSPMDHNRSGQHSRSSRHRRRWRTADPDREGLRVH